MGRLDRGRSGGGGDETAPCCDSRAGERIRPLRCARADVKPKLAGERGRFERVDFAADDDRRAIHLSDESSGVVAEHKFAKEDECLRESSAYFCGGGWGTYVFGLLLGYEMPRAVEEDIRPVPLLVDDAGELMAVAVPRCSWTPGESLDSTEGRVLEGSSVTLSATNVLWQTWITTENESLERRTMWEKNIVLTF